MPKHHTKSPVRHPINTRNASDRIFCFLTMLALGKTERVDMERAVERYADGADAVIRDGQREKKRKREIFNPSVKRNPSDARQIAQITVLVTRYLGKRRKKK